MKETSEVLLLPSKKKWALVFMGSLVFVLGGFWMITRGEIVGYFCTAFFSLGLVIPILQCFPSCSSLRLTAEGFELCSMFRKEKVKWSEIRGFSIVSQHRYIFYPIKIRINQMVAFNFFKKKEGMGALMSRKLARVDGALPDTYGMKASELEILMSKYLNEYTEPDGTGQPMSPARKSDNRLNH